VFATGIRTVAGDVDPSGSALDRLWDRTLTSAGHRYASPSRIVAYRGGEVPESRCAAGTTSAYWDANALYCFDDQTILFDEAWLRDFHARFGPFAPAAILAHEWGHHVQWLTGTPAISSQAELQADCYAGIHLSATEETSPGTYVVGGDLATALATFFEIGTKDYVASEWFAAGEHGSPTQRMMAMGTGYLAIHSGLPWCYGYRDFTPGDVVAIGPYRLLNLPGRTEEWVGSAYRIHPDDRSGSLTSRITMSWIDRLPAPGRGANADQLAAVMATELPGMQPLSEPISLDGNVLHGTGVVRYFEQLAGQVGGGAPVRRMVALASPLDGVGGLLVTVERPPVVLTDAAAMLLAEEQLVAVYQVVNRLCGPDQSGDTSDPDFNVACFEEQ
jgi:hypothetical protein